MERDQRDRSDYQLEVFGWPVSGLDGLRRVALHLEAASLEEAEV
jgi:hypothetical protein